MRQIASQKSKVYETTLLEDGLKNRPRVLIVLPMYDWPTFQSSIWDCGAYQFGLGKVLAELMEHYVQAE